MNAVWLAAAAALVLPFGVAGSANGPDQPDNSPIYGVALPAGYRQWQVISAAHEAGNLDDIRVILGNPLAVKAYRAGKRPFPDGAMLARVAWKLVPSARNNAVFGKAQSFVAGEATNVQISRKDAKRYAATGGWGYGQFENGKANPDPNLMQTCFACHAKLPAAEDFVFTRYAP
ncbi:cytochrome P460 family protein [Novosphingobium sp.]|uniref:cytochrome P460 family protein n=1 Tax=Novosphingobium sp. TaxID=1874826 RepID=UPI003BAD312A